MKLSIIMPVFNEEAVIETTHGRLLSLTDEMTGGKVIDDYEIIYVDDGSGDGSLNILKVCRFFIGGLNILFLGLIGEYIGKIYPEVKKRPLFMIKERYNMRGD